MNGSLSLALLPAQVEEEFQLRCRLCLTPAPLRHARDLDGGELHGVVELRFAAWPEPLRIGRDADGWRFLAGDDEALGYCRLHALLPCLRDACAYFGLPLPEGLR